MPLFIYGYVLIIHDVASSWSIYLNVKMSQLTPTYINVKQLRASLSEVSDLRIHHAKRLDSGHNK